MNKKTTRMNTVQEPPPGYNESAVMIYQSPEGIQVDVTVKRETVWLSLNQMATLFDRDKSVISRHLRNVFKEKELDWDSVVAFFATTASISSSRTIPLWTATNGSAPPYDTPHRRKQANGKGPPLPRPH